MISDWVTFPVKGFGKLWAYNLQKERADFQFIEESGADIFYDRASDKIWIPQMFQNKVVINSRRELFSSSHSKANVLYNYGIIDAFIGGLYKGTFPIKNLKLKGILALAHPICWMEN